MRLCDVAPDGSSLLVTRGLLNLTHRERPRAPRPLVPGEPAHVRVRAEGDRARLPAGHRLRLAVSPTLLALGVAVARGRRAHAAHGRREPARVAGAPAAPEEARPPAFADPETGEPLPVEAIPGVFRDGIQAWRDVATGRSEVRVFRDNPAERVLESGIEIEHLMDDTYSIVAGDPLSARARCRSTTSVGRADWRTRVECDSAMTATAEAFLVTTRVEAYEGETRVFARSAERSIPRDLV